MRSAVWVLWLAACLLCGCAGERRSEAASTARPLASPRPSPAVPASSRGEVADAGHPVASAASASASAGRSPDSAPLPRIDIQPLGAALPEVDVAFVERALGAFYAVEVRRLGRVELPDSAKNAARTRYRAEKLLDFIDARRAPDTRFVLGLTSADISTTKPPHSDWGILGLATVDGSACVISSFRTHRLAKGEEHARVHLGKVAVHEVGHNLGLEHCPHRSCLMEDAQGTVLTTDREYDLCDSCRRHLGAIAIGGPALVIPWPKPE